MKLVKKGSYHDDGEAVQGDPLPVFGRAQLVAALGGMQVRLQWRPDNAQPVADEEVGCLVNYYSYGCEPSMIDVYNSLQPMWCVKAVEASGWQVKITLQEVASATLFRYITDLEKGSWALRPLRQVPPEGVLRRGQCWCEAGETTSEPLVETDERGYFVTERPCTLPPVGCFSMGALPCPEGLGAHADVEVHPGLEDADRGDGRVMLSAGYKEHDDAAQGPLHPGETGVIDRSDGGRLRVSTDKDARTWWYYPAALKVVSTKPALRLSLCALNLAPAAGAVGCGGRTKLHGASLEACAEILDRASVEELSQLLTACDNCGATAFHEAMKQQDIQLATQLLRKGSELGDTVAAEMCVAADMCGNLPLHSLLGLAEDSTRPISTMTDAPASDAQAVGPATVPGSKTSQAQARLEAQFDGLTELCCYNALVCARHSVTQHTALQDFIYHHGRLSHWRCINRSGVNIRSEPSMDGPQPPIGRLKNDELVECCGSVAIGSQTWVQIANPARHGVSKGEAWALVKQKGPRLLEPAVPSSAYASAIQALCANVEAVKASLEHPSSSEGGVDRVAVLEWMDNLAYAVIRCGEAFAGIFSCAVKRLCDDAETVCGRLFVAAAARVFVGLFSVDTVREEDAPLRPTFTKVFENMGAHGISALAEVAARAVESVRLGLPTSMLTPAVFAVHSPTLGRSVSGVIESLLPIPEQPTPLSKKKHAAQSASGGDIAIGQRVTVIEDFENEDYDDASDGPLRPGDEGLVESLQDSRCLVRPRSRDRDGERASVWWYDQAVLVAVDGRGQSYRSKKRKPDEPPAAGAALVARARMFHLCVVVIIHLGMTPTLARTTTHRFVRQNPLGSNTTVELGDTDAALLLATQTFQPIWAYVFDAVQAIERMLESASATATAEENAATRSAMSSSRLQTTAAEHGPKPEPQQGEGGSSGWSCLSAAQQLRGVCGGGDVEAERYRFLAFLLDALVRFKQQALPVLEAGDTEVDAPELRGLARSISHLQSQPPEALRDAWSAQRRDELLAHLETMDSDSPVSSSDGNAQHVGRNLRRSPLLWFLFHHRRTIEMLASIEGYQEGDQESFLHVLQPYEKKQQRVHQRMSERRTSIPEDRPRLELCVRRGDDLTEDLFKILADARTVSSEHLDESVADSDPAPPRVSRLGLGASAHERSDGGEDEAAAAQLPLCRKLECTYKGEPGEGTGMTRMVVTDVAKALRAGTGIAAGLFVRSPLVRGPEEGWWEREPMGRVVPAPFELPEDSSEEAMAMRESALRGIGNVIGLCLLHGVKFPLFFCRHVYKALLGRKVNYADYAYFDPQNHATLLQAIRDARQMGRHEDMMMAWDESVGYPEPADESEDAPAVTPANVHAFVLRKAHFDMVCPPVPQLVVSRQ